MPIAYSTVVLRISLGKVALKLAPCQSHGVKWQQHHSELLSSKAAAFPAAQEGKSSYEPQPPMK